MKDFNSWNKEKIKTDLRTDAIPYFEEGDIWWVKLGLNIGFETDGKGIRFERPVLIIKKYNQYSFLCVPLSTQAQKVNKYKIPLGLITGRTSVVNISQMRNLDSRRLINKLAHIETTAFREIKQKISLTLFS